MSLRQLFVLMIASFVLSGCYVYATVPPAPNGPAFDDRLVGAWFGLDEKGKPVPNAFLHFTKPKDKGPMHMVSAETDDYDVFEVHTAQASSKRVFAVRKIAARVRAETEPDADKYVLGAYGDTLVIRVFEPDKLRDAVAASRVRGTAGTGNFASVTLTGSPDEVIRFLASPEADAALSKPHPLARRLPQPR
jgi:hypothetical protein